MVIAAKMLEAVSVESSLSSGSPLKACFAGTDASVASADIVAFVGVNPRKQEELVRS